MKETAKAIEDFLFYAEKNLGLCPEDRICVKNLVLGLLKTDWEEEEGEEHDINETLNILTEDAIMRRVITDDEAEIFKLRLMGAITPMQSVVDKEFKAKFARNYKIAVSYFYGLAKKSGYIKLDKIKRNIYWSASGSKGKFAVMVDMGETRSVSKNSDSSVAGVNAYKGPFYMTPKHFSDPTLRMVPFTIFGEGWHMQYSPCMLYEEHCLMFKDEQVPMKITADTMKKMLRFTDYIPDYFFACEDDLPKKKGSFSYEHYYGGRKFLPIFKTSARKNFEKKYGILMTARDWYSSIVTIIGTDKNEISARGMKIVDTWRTYTDEANGIYSSEENVHNSVNIIASRSDTEYFLDIVLRSNAPSEKCPWGAFDVPAEARVIKDDTLCYTDIMGLVSLPSKVQEELMEIIGEVKKEKPDLNRITEDPDLKKYADILVRLMSENKVGLRADEAREAVLEKVNELCGKILENTAVFKNTYDGQLAFDKFMETAFPYLVKKKKGRKPKNQKSDEDSENIETDSDNLDSDCTEIEETETETNETKVKTDD